MDSRAHRQLEPTDPTVPETPTREPAPSSETRTSEPAPSDAPTAEPPMDRASASAPESRSASDAKPTNRPVDEPADRPTRDAEPRPSVDKHDEPDVPPTDTSDTQPPPARRQRMANHLLFNRDGWGQARPEVEVDNPREQNQPAEPDSADETPAPHPTEHEPTPPTPQTSLDAVEERVSDPKDREEPAASPEPATTPEAADIGERKDTNTSRPPDETRSYQRGFTVDLEVDGEPVRARFDRWDPERLTMPRPARPDVSDAQAGERTEASERTSRDVRTGVAYIAANKDTRPWLAPAARCEPIVQSVYASIDLSEGHGHIRHGAMGSDDLQARRVAFNEDPAQTDPVKRELGIDGLDPTKQHYCGKDSTRVHDATALAAVYVMAAEHPKVRAILDAPFDENVQPRDLVVPITELLGEDGYEFCSGFRLKNWPESKAARKEWLQAKRTGSDLSGLREPEVEPIPTFEGGDIKIVFKRNLEAKKYGIYTLFPRPFEE